MVKKFFTPPRFYPSELIQRARFLHFMLIGSSIGALSIGGINFMMDATALANALFALSSFCIVGIYLNNRGQYYIAASMFSILILAISNFNLIDGAGLHDPGVAIYPIFIMITGYLFGRQGLPFTTGLAILSIYSILWLAENNFTEPTYEPTASRVQILAILLTLTGIAVWVITDNWLKTIQQLRDSYDLTIVGWAKALEVRDVNTEGHSRRVTEVTTTLAKRLGCDSNEIIHIRRGAYLHDIGKLAIPDRILFKAGPLTPEERKLIEQHPKIAKLILEKIPFLEPALDIPYCHHERWDGKGYPTGLAGEDIPRAARIFTVVDHWEALSSDRPYRKAWDRRDIHQYLIDNSGIIFDPAIVPAFLDLLDSYELNQI